MRLTRHRIAITAAFGLIATSAMAADKPAAPPPAVVQKLLECRAITDTAQRLACLDAGVSALADAVASRDVLVADREQVKRAKRSLFGLALPSFNLFGKDDVKDDSGKADERGVTQEIEATIASARLGYQGNWRLVLDDDSVWLQTDGASFRHDPKAGMKIRIRRAAVGSFLANIAGQTSVRVKRIQD
jgi:hypothetical protein